MTTLREAAQMAYAVPLHELLATVPRDARLVIEDADGKGTRFIPVGRYCHEAAEALRAALAADKPSADRLAQPEQEPWGYISHRSWKMPVFVEADNLEVSGLPFNNPDYTPVYKAPLQRECAGTVHDRREWQGLTDEERTYLAWESNNGLECVAMTEAKLKEKNS